MAHALILIIDDNPLNLELVAYLLTNKKYEVSTAANAHEAMKILSICKPRLILMDLQLPDMDGLELTRKLKNDPKYQNIPIIAITARAMESDKQKALEAGCDGYITKPIDVNTLPNIIAKYISKK